MYPRCSMAAGVLRFCGPFFKWTSRDIKVPNWPFAAMVTNGRSGPETDLDRPQPVGNNVRTADLVARRCECPVLAPFDHVRFPPKLFGTSYMPTLHHLSEQGFVSLKVHLGSIGCSNRRRLPAFSNTEGRANELCGAYKLVSRAELYG